MIDLTYLVAAISFGSLLTSTLTFSAPLILGALGGLCSERSGVINIGLEGKMLAAACATGYIAQASQDPVLGLTAGILVATLLAMLHWTLTQTYRIDHIISGMGINALCAGGTSLISKTFPELGSKQMAAFSIYVYWLCAWTAVIAIWWILKSTRGGLRLYAVGNDPDKSRQMGIKPGKVRLQALLGTGLLTGLAGALIVTNAGSFSDGMTSGRGYIALAALILGGWRPWPTLIAAVLFGLFDSLQLQLQGQPLFGQVIPGEFWQALPYLVTLVALAGIAGKSRAPAGLGKP
ncbi:MAG: ABC transporter permease [Fimbriimonadaceae bacterium]|nr:MAG: ABC transporter permease [Fimbriimonadaceae bacterium]